MRALVRARSLHLVGGEHLAVATSEATVARIFDELCPVLRCTLPDGSERIVLRSAVTAYEAEIIDRPADVERWWD